MLASPSSRTRPLPALLALLCVLPARFAGAQAAPNLFRDDTLNTLNPTQSAKDAHFPMTAIEQGAFTCGARFTNDVDLLSPRPIIFYDLCNVNNSTRVTKAVDHLVIDCTPGPGLQLIDRPQSYSRSGAPEFVFAAGGRPAQCSLDGGAFAPCASPFHPAGLADGPHRLTVRTAEPDGGTGSALQFDWTVDRAPPVAPGLRLSDPSDGDTKAVEVSGEGEPGALVGIVARAGRASASAQARVDESGRFRATLDLSAFPEGMIAAVATQLDAAGNASPPGTATALKKSPAASAAVFRAASPLPPGAAPVPVAAFAGGAGGTAAAPAVFPAAAPFLVPEVPSEAAACLSPDPSQWPASAKPYFLIIVDTSASMSSCTTPPTVYPVECNAASPGYTLNSCGLIPNRMNDAKCAVRKLIQAYSGEADFGLETYASYLTNCLAGACISDCGAPTGANCSSDVNGCTFNLFPGAADACGNLPSCVGTGPAAPNFPKGTWRNGGNFVTPLLQQPTWLPPPPPADNTAELLKWFDGQCGDNKEIFAAGGTPIAGSLRSAAQYLRAGWTQWSTTNYCAAGLSYSYQTPLSSQDQPCRSVNVLLITDGDESCDTQADAVAAAQDLFQTGATLGTNVYPVKTYVINFAGGSQANTDAIAAAGGTGASILATNEATLSTAISNILVGAVKPETGDNSDNNCNGCTDEGFTHYANVQPVPANCCAWATGPQRTTCLNNYKASITPANPLGNRNLLPCTSYAQQTAPATWLVYDPGERCDNVDNNGVNGVDEGVLRCGSPLHCPTTEVCNGQDDNCDGIVDNGCPGVVGAEVCNGCDDDFNGLADDGIAPAPCGGSSPANCSGTRSCKPAQPVTPGGCVAGGGWNACSNSPQTETCGDGLDNNCNGALDDGNNCPYAGRTEICNGVDDNCNGLIDEGVTPPPDAKSSICGVSPVASAPECTGGVTVSCTGGAWQCAFPAGVCTAGGGCAATAEICDTLDNNCDGRSNENVPDYGQVCHSDDANPVPGDGACRTTGVKVCNGSNATICSAVKANCGTLPGGCAELCDGIDNDCDGSLDETYLAKGSNATYFVKPVVTKIASSLWIYSYEATRANASVSGNAPGSGNGYWCQAFNAGDPNCNDATIPVAPAGVTLDKTRACSGPLTGPANRIPWFNVTPVEAGQTCKAMGGHLCTTAEWQTACLTNPPSGTNCTWGYNPRGAACTSAFIGTKFCNLGPFDFNGGSAGDQDGLLVTANPNLLNCWADWSALLGNTATTNRIYDITGNLREITKSGASTYPVMGGAFASQSDAGATCNFNFYTVDQNYQFYDAGFRCCFTVDPTL